MNAPTAPALSWHRLVLRDARGWHESLIRLGILALLFTLFFHADVIDLVRVWMTSTPYSHCIFLPMIIIWLVWQMRDALAQLDPQRWPLALIWLGLGALAWMLGWAGGIALFRHAGLIVMGQGLVLLALGPVVGRALAFPIFYAFFMIPVGTEAEPVLQIVTARMAIHMLWLAGVPAEISGIFITTPTGYFRVAEACSGTGFLISMAAFSTLVAHLFFKSPLRRAIFIIGSLVLCLLANGVRAFGIILVAFHEGMDSAVVVDHVVYGWLFFASVIIMLMLLGWRFFDRSPFDRWFDPSALQGPSIARPGIGWGLMLASVSLMVAPIAWAAAAHAFGDPLPSETRPPEVAGWMIEPDGLVPPWEPHFVGADRIIVTHYRDAQDRVVDLAIVLFAYQTEGKELVGYGQGAAGPDGPEAWTWSESAPAPDQARGEMLVGPGMERRLAYTFYHVGGTITGQASRVKYETLKVRLLGREQRAAAIIVNSMVMPGADGEARSAQALTDFLKALGPVEDLADRSLAIR